MPVTAAGVSDNAAAPTYRRASPPTPCITNARPDTGSHTKVIDAEITGRGPAHKGFKVIPAALGLKRTSSWLMHRRRLARDYEAHTHRSEAMAKVTVIALTSCWPTRESTRTGALTHHGNGLHVPPARKEPVHLRPHLNRQPVPQSIPHTRIEPHGPRPTATTTRVDAPNTLSNGSRSRTRGSRDVLTCGRASTQTGGGRTRTRLNETRTETDGVGAPDRASALGDGQAEM